MTWRNGRKAGRTIYLQKGDDPSDEDQLIGMMDTTELSERVVRLIQLQDLMPEVIQSLLDLHNSSIQPAPAAYPPPKRLG